MMNQVILYELRLLLSSRSCSAFRTWQSYQDKSPSHVAKLPSRLTPVLYVVSAVHLRRFPSIQISKSELYKTGVNPSVMYTVQRLCDMSRKRHTHDKGTLKSRTST
eukprot:6214699-Pleurochrysis_carterae.AAC.2